MQQHELREFRWPDPERLDDGMRRAAHCHRAVDLIVVLCTMEGCFDAKGLEQVDHIGDAIPQSSPIGVRPSHYRLLRRPMRRMWGMWRMGMMMRVIVIATLLEQ